MRNTTVMQSTLLITLLLSQRLTKQSFKPKYMKSPANKQAQEWETSE